MVDFYKVRFQASPKGSQIPDYFAELMESVHNWLSQRYGNMVNGIIPNWDEFIDGGAFGEKDQLGCFFAETVSNRNGDLATMSAWACSISEYLKAYPDRKWITEIGYRRLSEKEAEFSYYVGYEAYPDPLERFSKPKPSFNIPGVARALLTTDKWNCCMNGTPIDADIAHYSTYTGKLFGIEECRSLKEEGRKEETSPENARWISLCKVNRRDKNNDVWLLRLADCEDGTLVAPVFDASKEKIFENRPLIFCEDGPTTPDRIGFWEWAERKSESGQWRTEATYIEQVTPIEIVILDNVSGVSGIIGSLKSGVEIPSYVYGKFLLASKNGLSMEGLLCELNESVVRVSRDNRITIKNETYSLPCYDFYESDIFTWKNRTIFKQITLHEPKRLVPVVATGELIKQYVLQHLNWPVFKAQGISKSDWRKIKDLISAIPIDTIVGKICETYGMTPQEAQNCIDEFLQKVRSHIDVKDVDSDIIVRMIENHAELQETCYSIAEQKWKDLHAKKIADATKELEAIRKTIASTEEDRDKLSAETASAQEKLNQLQKEIIRNEALARDTVAAIQKRIADAQTDMASFIADLSPFLPNNHSTSNTLSQWNYRQAIERKYSEDDFEFADNWRNEYDAIFQNISAAFRIDSELCSMLTAFLYSSYINKTPILIAGPLGDAMAEIVSVSLFGIGAGMLAIGNGIDNSTCDCIHAASEHIIFVHNMFGNGWTDTLPQVIRDSEKQIVWTHPFVEDLQIEPKGLYNYMIPVFSESFVEAYHSADIIPGKRTENFRPFSPQKRKSIRVPEIKKLGFSKLFLNQLEQILSDAKSLLDTPAREIDIDILFGLLPLSVLTGRTDILKEVIESKSGISNSVKAEAARYYSEE